VTASRHKRYRRTSPPRACRGLPRVTQKGAELLCSLRVCSAFLFAKASIVRGIWRTTMQQDESAPPPLVITLVHGTILFERWRFWSRQPQGVETSSSQGTQGSIRAKGKQRKRSSGSKRVRSFAIDC
jgi:hypothetical protein